VGAGAIGSGLGALLHRVGHEVTLIGRPRHVAVINRRGLMLEESGGSGFLPTQAAERLTFKPSLLIVATKVQNVAEACRQSLPHTSGVSAGMLRNGVENDAIAGNVLGRENVIDCVIRWRGVSGPAACVCG